MMKNFHLWVNFSLKQRWSKLGVVIEKCSAGNKLRVQGAKGPRSFSRTFSESARIRRERPCRVSPSPNQSLLTVVILKKTAVTQTFCQAYLKHRGKIEQAPSETPARRQHFRPCCAEERLSGDSDASLPRQSHPGTWISISGLMSAASGASYSLRLKSLPLHQAAINHVGSQ